MTNRDKGQKKSNSGLNEETTVLHGEGTTLSRDLRKAKEQEACLIIIRGVPQGHRFFLTQDSMIIGRDVEADISLSDQSISRKHARVEKKAGKVFLIDLRSANGTFINDKKVSPNVQQALAKEDMVKLGNLILKFIPAGEFETLAWGAMNQSKITDALTLIYNKGYLVEALSAEFKRAKALHTDFSMIIFDLDHFKKINDGHGHDAGDYVLKEFSRLIRSSYLRPKDIFARYGGGGIVIFFCETNATKAPGIAGRIRA
ncbi:GGDEF domain-containing protein, partial [Bdellovibrionota bacterium FG-2]